MRLLLFLLAAPLFAGYTHSTKITIVNHPASTLTNYVLFVCANGAASTNCDSAAHVGLNLANLPTVGNGGAMTSALAYDSIIATTGACTTKADFDMEAGVYDPVTGSNIWHVRVPTVSSSVDTVAGYLCWADATVTTYQGTTAAWPAEYLARWGYPNASSLSVADSTAGAHNGTITGGVGSGTGQIDGAAVPNGTTGYITASGFTSLAGASATWSCWVYPAADGSTMMFMGAIDANAPYVDRFSSGIIESSSAPFATPLHTIETIPINTWSMVTMVTGIVSSPHQKVYINGVEATYSDLGGGPTLGPVTSLHIGAYFDNSFKWNGKLDECLWINTDKTADWVAAKYANESAPYNYYTFGPDTPLGTSVRRVLSQ